MLDKQGHGFCLLLVWNAQATGKGPVRSDRIIPERVDLRPILLGHRRDSEQPLFTYRRHVSSAQYLLQPSEAINIQAIPRVKRGGSLQRSRLLIYPPHDACVI